MKLLNSICLKLRFKAEDKYVWLDIDTAQADVDEAQKYLDDALWALNQASELDLEFRQKAVIHAQSRIDSFQAITFTVLGIIVAAISFIGVSQITKMDLNDPSIWQIITWITFMVSLLSLTGVLVFAGIKILRRK